MVRNVSMWLVLAVCASVAICLGSGCEGVFDKEANARFLKNLGNDSITVFPTVVRQKDIRYDPAAARTIEETLNALKVGEIHFNDAEIPIAGTWHMNQSRMFRESFHSFADYLREHPVDTDYALLAEYMGGSGGFGGIHCFVVDKEGRLAYAVGLNSHHKPFKDVMPTTVEQCNAVLTGVLREELKPAAGE